jgi:hypothetical protein
MATGRIGTTPVLQVRWSKAPSAGTTSLSGLDDNSVSLVYSVGYEAVYRNGVLLSRTNDYTATDGTTITLIDATIAGDIIEVFANQTIPLTDTYSQTVSDGRFIKNTLTTTTGDIIYASAANTPARLGIGSTDQVLKVSGGIPAWGAAGSSFVGCALYSASSQTISNSVQTAVTWDSERFDTDGFHSTSTNTSRITIPTGKGGKYLFVWNHHWHGSATGERYTQLYKNGSATDMIDGGKRNNFNVNAGNTQGAAQIVNAVAGDYFEVFAQQTSGGNLGVTVANEYNQFSCVYLGA